MAVVAPRSEEVGPDRAGAAPARRPGPSVPLFAATAAGGAALLFVVQPLTARLLLPRLGGAPAVWNTAMVFFQVTLLGGYVLAHALWRARPLTVRQGAVPLLLFGAALTLPVALAPDAVPPSGGGATWWVVATLAAVVGLPFLALATLAPTLQAWFSATDHPRAADPYFLYAAGNVGSAAGLVGYPLVIEPNLGLRAQGWVWAGAYVAVAVGVALCSSSSIRRRGGAVPRPEAASVGLAPTIRRRVVLFAAVPSGLLLAVTRHLTGDVASLPLLWVLPLLAYLATFVVVFRRPTDGPSPRLVRWSMVAGVVVVATAGGSVPSVTLGLVLHLGAFVVLALVCHARLAALRPPAEQLTSYYLWMSVGGALGGSLVALVAPVVLDDVWEYPWLAGAAVLIAGGAAPVATVRRATWAGVGVVVAALAALGHGWATEARAPLYAAAIVGAGVAVLAVGRSPRVVAVGLAGLALTTPLVDLSPTLHQRRSFFGVSRVTAVDGEHRLLHGTTVHGAQSMSPRPSLEPTTYYRTTSGVGRLLAATERRRDGRRVAVVGLGAGTLAAYGRTGDRFDVFEIDPDVVAIATDPRWFTYLAETPAVVRTVLGDGRLGLAASDERYDLVVLDAFSSDAIPTHLLTLEALREYRDRLAPGGVLAFHVSNRFFDLVPVVARLAGELGMRAHVREDGVSQWVAVSGPEVAPDLAAELAAPAWRRAEAPLGTPTWTDDRTDLLAVVKAW